MKKNLRKIISLMLTVLLLSGVMPMAAANNVQPPPDYPTEIYYPVNSESDIIEDDKYIIVAVKTGADGTESYYTLDSQNDETSPDGKRYAHKVVKNADGSISFEYSEENRPDSLPLYFNLSDADISGYTRSGFYAITANKLKIYGGPSYRFNYRCLPLLDREVPWYFRFADDGRVIMYTRGEFPEEGQKAYLRYYADSSTGYFVSEEAEGKDIDNDADFSGFFSENFNLRLYRGKCQHKSMMTVPQTEADCRNTGCAGMGFCPECNKYFMLDDPDTPINLSAQLFTPPTAHTFIDGKCSVCGVNDENSDFTKIKANSSGQYMFDSDKKYMIGAEYNGEYFVMGRALSSDGKYRRAVRIDKEVYGYVYASQRDVETVSIIYRSGRDEIHTSGGVLVGHNKDYFTVPEAVSTMITAEDENGLGYSKYWNLWNAHEKNMPFYVEQTPEGEYVFKYGKQSPGGIMYFELYCEHSNYVLIHSGAEASCSSAGGGPVYRCDKCGKIKTDVSLLKPSSEHEYYNGRCIHCGKPHEEKTFNLTANIPNSDVNPSIIATKVPYNGKIYVMGNKVTEKGINAVPVDPSRSITIDCDKARYVFPTDDKGSNYDRYLGTDGKYLAELNGKLTEIFSKDAGLKAYWNCDDYYDCIRLNDNSLQLVLITDDGEPYFSLVPDNYGYEDYNRIVHLYNYDPDAVYGSPYHCERVEPTCTHGGIEEYYYDPVTACYYRDVDLTDKIPYKEPHPEYGDRLDPLILSKVPHKDDDGDGYCDYCHKNIPVYKKVSNITEVNYADEYIIAAEINGTTYAMQLPFTTNVGNRSNAGNGSAENKYSKFIPLSEITKNSDGSIDYLSCQHADLMRIGFLGVSPMTTDNNAALIRTEVDGKAGFFSVNPSYNIDSLCDSTDIWVLVFDETGNLSLKVYGGTEDIKAFTGTAQYGGTPVLSSFSSDTSVTGFENAASYPISLYRRTNVCRYGDKTYTVEEIHSEVDLKPAIDAGICPAENKYTDQYNLSGIYDAIDRETIEGYLDTVTENNLTVQITSKIILDSLTLDQETFDASFIFSFKPVIKIINADGTVLLTEEIPKTSLNGENIGFEFNLFDVNPNYLSLDKGGGVNEGYYGPQAHGSAYRKNKFVLKNKLSSDPIYTVDNPHLYTATVKLNEPQNTEKQFYKIKVNGGKAVNNAGEIITQAEELSMFKLIADPAPAGMEFYKWVGNNEYSAAVPCDTPESEGMLVCDYEITAIYRVPPIKKIPVSYRTNGGSGTMADMELEEGTSLVLPHCEFTPPEGKAFKAWSIGGTEYAAGESCSTITDYTNIIPVWKEASAVAAGDINNDGEINICDLVMLKKVIVNVVTSYEPAAADVNGDGSVNADDLIALRRKLIMI